MSVTSENTLDTRHRLLQAAGEVFADRGFHAASIREIVEKAGANVAAVNYHFGGKEALYGEVLAFSCAGATVWEEADAQAPPAEQLRAFVRGFLHHCLGADRPAWQGRLMAREMAEPSAALTTLVDRVMRPVHEQLQSLVKQIAPHLTEAQAWMCAQSVIAQCAFQKHAQEITARLDAPLPQGGGRIEALTDHITRFSIAAMEHFE